MTTKILRVSFTIFAVSGDKVGEFMQERTLEALQKFMRRRKHQRVSYGQHLDSDFFAKHEEYVIEDTPHNRTNLTHLYSGTLARCANEVDKFGICFSSWGVGYSLEFKAGHLPSSYKKAQPYPHELL